MDRALRWKSFRWVDGSADSKEVVLELISIFVRILERSHTCIFVTASTRSVKVRCDLHVWVDSISLPHEERLVQAAVLEMRQNQV